MTGGKTIFHNGKQVALIFNEKIKTKGLTFLTDNDNPLQVGIHNQVKGTVLSPHVHSIKKFPVIKQIQEILLVKKGKIKIFLYTNKGLLIAKRILKEGDSILIMDIGHGVEFIEDSVVHMVKQGPYQDGLHQKIFLKNDTGK